MRKTLPSLAGIVVLTAWSLSAIWRVPYIYTVLGFAGLVVMGHLTTLDDDFPGGWSNPDGTEPFPWQSLAIKVTLLFVWVYWPFFHQAFDNLAASDSMMPIGQKRTFKRRRSC